MQKITLLLALCFCFVSLAGFSQDETCNSVTSDTPVPTGDNDVEQTAVISITDELFITSMTMDIEITHSFIGDVKFDLISPSGTRIIVCPGLCTDRRNMDCTFTDAGSRVECNETPATDPMAVAVTGDITPLSDFSNFNSEPTLGDWTLSITDTGPGDTGTITSWTLNYCGTTTLSSPEQQLLNSVTIAPNPARETINVVLPDGLMESQVSATVLDVSGRVIYSKNSLETTLIPVSSLASGIYIINLSTNQFTTSRRFVVE